ncbi:hypothetical protein D3C83_258290 [compost metagenome]
MDESLARSAIEKARGFGLLLDRRGTGLGDLQSRPQGRTLSAVTDIGRARLAHVLLGGIDSGHAELSKKTRKKC